MDKVHLKPQMPLIVDMDGALLKTDTTFEALARGIFEKPFATLAALATLWRGRAHFKRRMAELISIDVDALPLRDDFVQYLACQRAAGRDLHLVSGSDHEVVSRVAERVGLFESALGSGDGRNLKGSAKAEVLRQKFGAYAYAGDAPADLNVWRHASAILLAGASASTARKARGLAIPVEAEFAEHSNPVAGWVKALRLHQWAKNLLLFVPLLLAGRVGEPGLLLQCTLGFFILGATASGTYIINDLADIGADRKHRSKHRRPFAAGDLRIYQGLIIGPALILGGLASAFLLSQSFGYALAVYLFTTFAYSFRLKAIPFLDVILLAWLYTLRLLMGVALASSDTSEWLLTFSMVFFFSMSLAKRHTEVVATESQSSDIAGRGYLPKDAPITLAFGVSSSVASLLIMVLYLMEEAFPSNVYNQPGALWLVVPILAIWTMRVWLLAHRGEMNDDPVAFAITDQVSLMLGGVLALAFAYAVLG